MAPPGRPGSKRRLSWLEAEYARLGYECEYLESLNAILNRKLQGGDEEVDSVDDNAESDKDDDDETDWEGPSTNVAEELDGQGLTLDDIHLEASAPRTSVQSPAVTPGAPTPPLQRRKTRVEYRPDETEGPAPEHMRMESDPFLPVHQTSRSHYLYSLMQRGSALGGTRPAQVLIYIIAFAGLVFVLVAHATHLGAHETEAGHGGDDGHRRLGGAAPPLLKNIALALVSAGAVSFVVNALQWPLCIGYILGGVLVGPNVLKLVFWEGDIRYVFELGLVFLLFMIGCGLDFRKLWGLDRVSLAAGFAQFPLCVCSTFVIFSLLQVAFGLELGKGEYAITYASLACSLSSTLIVGKLLGQFGEKDTPAGKVTTGVLLIQDLWAIVVLACQPNMDFLHPRKMLVSFFCLAIILFVALAYAKLVMPPVLFSASKSVELMLVLALAWLFFVISASILPLVELSMELGALIGGAALATFPYSVDLNSKVHYVRDFFITIFFIGMGVDVPAPTWSVILKALLVCVVVLFVRWVSIPVLVTAVGGEVRVGVLATLNLSQISELALAICIMGTRGGFGPLNHIDQEFMTVIIWAFSILAISGSYCISYNYKVMRGVMSAWRRCAVWLHLKQAKDAEGGDEDEDQDYHHQVQQGDIVILGFHRITALLIAEFMMKSPKVIQRLHVIDINPGLADGLREKGIGFTFGDFASAKELKRCHPDKATIIMSTIPDSLLKGVSNLKLLHVAKKVWPDAHFIATADNPAQAQKLYDAGADYVVRMAKLCAMRLHELLVEHCSKAFGGGDLKEELDKELFNRFKVKDKDARSQEGGFLALRM